ncbi:MAG TPA: IS200/IS605 family transposase [Bacteroidia bacterium]|nr:IS200/IS605 family transposase [Bacteroidia bacterium]
MADSYSKIFIHLILCVKRTSMRIVSEHEEEIHKYISGIIAAKNQKVLIINGIPNHIHILLGMKPTCNLSDLVRDIKANSSRFINERNFTQRKFEWQHGFGAFSVGHSQVDMVGAYIRNQKEHHKVKTFNEEYLEFLRDHQIEYKEEYVFEEVPVDE